jgi:L-histidine Nalpha-methyltransferase
LRRDYPNLNVSPVIGDFQDRLQLEGLEAPRLVALLGSTIGNLLPDERARFLHYLGEELQPGDALLLGADLVKDPATLLNAYDDEAGVTAAFNKHLLTVLNRRLGADFRLDDFAHQAVWDAAHERIEMHLRARRTHTVKIPALDLAIHFEEGEALLTETSAKFRRDTLEHELAHAGLEPRHWWTDTRGRYALSLAAQRS